MRAGEETQLWELFHGTVRSINLRDYSEEQVAAWSPQDRDMAAWAERMQQIHPFVVVCRDQIVGYSDLQDDGLVDHLFVHRDWQGRGVASVLMNEVERRAESKALKSLYAHVSLTARPLFERRGFQVEKENRVMMGSVELINFLMRRQLV